MQADSSNKVAEGGDRGEIAGGGHDTQRHCRKRELEESQHQASKSARHALDVLHPRPRRTVGGIGERRCLNWVHRRVAYIHRFREEKMLYRHCAHGFLRSAQLKQFLTIKIGDCIDFYNSKRIESVIGRAEEFPAPLCNSDNPNRSIQVPGSNPR